VPPCGLPLLQFYVDFNVYGMGYLHATSGKVCGRELGPALLLNRQGREASRQATSLVVVSFLAGPVALSPSWMRCLPRAYQARLPLPPSRRPVLVAHGGCASLASASLTVSGHPLYTTGTVPTHGRWHGLCAHRDLAGPVARMSSCELEVDVWADDIWNPSMRNPHVAATAGASAKVEAVSALPSLTALWEVRWRAWRWAVGGGRWAVLATKAATPCVGSPYSRTRRTDARRTSVAAESCFLVAPCP
jgi:hypothetical protein